MVHLNDAPKRYNQPTFILPIRIVNGNRTSAKSKLPQVDYNSPKCNVQEMLREQESHHIK